MKFWEYNKMKILTIGGTTYVLSLIVLVLITNGIGGISQVILVPLLPATIAMLVVGVKGLFYFKSIDRLIEEDSERSLLSLFDNGYTVDLVNESSWFWFTSERVKGTFSGFPVTVAFSYESRTKRPNLVISFYPIMSPGLKTQTIRSISFYTGVRGKLLKDIKPEIIAFIEGLKSEGYTA